VVGLTEKPEPDTHHSGLFDYSGFSGFQASDT
jgi:hypothetical protein